MTFNHHRDSDTDTDSDFLFLQLNTIRKSLAGIHYGSRMVSTPHYSAMQAKNVPPDQTPITPSCSTIRSANW